jgi:hypothetical protein
MKNYSLETNMLTVNLPDRLEESTFFTKDPFVIFEIDNFIDNDFYQLLVSDLKSRQEFDRVFSQKGNKKKFSLGGHNIDKYEDCPFKTFSEYFLSQTFFDWFVTTHLPSFPQSGRPYHVYNTNDPEFIEMKSSNVQLEAPFTFYNTEVHYSLIEGGGFIPPHTDSPKKRLSIVFYVPDGPVSDDMEEVLGTVFYREKRGKKLWKRFKSGLLNEKATTEFLDNHEVSHTTKFQMNKCAGFIKSDISWHAVKPNPYDYDRRAIVINILEI